jgi:hypothetical protein
VLVYALPLAGTSSRYSMPPLRTASQNSIQTLPYPGLSFITFSDPTQSRLPRQRKAVRSHAASYQYQLDKASPANRALGTRKKARRRKLHAPITLEINNSAQLDQLNGAVVPYTPSPFGILGEGRIDPFRTYPVPWEPFLPEVIDHCRYSFKLF